MAAAALTPRIRLMAICDQVRESRTEAGVYHLRGVRHQIMTKDTPLGPVRLCLFLLLSSPRAGTFPGYIRIINERTDKAIFFAKLTPTPEFEQDESMQASETRIQCAFPEERRYTVQLWFFQKQGYDVLKGELPFPVVLEGA